MQKKKNFKNNTKDIILNLLYLDLQFEFEITEEIMNAKLSRRLKKIIRLCWSPKDEIQFYIVE